MIFFPGFACLLDRYGMNQKGVLVGFFSFRILGFLCGKAPVSSHEYQHHKILRLKCRAIGKSHTQRISPGANAGTLAKTLVPGKADVLV